MKYVIMCGGTYNNFKTPKQLTKVNNEPLVLRTIRLLKTMGISCKDILITSNNPIFDNCGVDRLENKANTFRQNAPWSNMRGYWVDAFYPFDEPVTYLFGDVFYSHNLLRTIISSTTDDVLFFGSNPLVNTNGINMKKWEEPFCFKVVNQKHFREAIKEVKTLFKKGLFKRHPIAWELYRVLNNYPINEKIFDKNFVCVNDISTDVDKPEDGAFIEEMLEKYGEELKEDK